MTATLPPIAALPMYDWPELTSAHDVFWQKLAERFRSHGIAAPEFLTHDTDDQSHWLKPHLLLGQTCGYPFATALREKVTYVATPIYDVEGCSGPYYSSAILVRKNSPLTTDKLAGSRFAFNSKTSLSGYRAIKALIGEPDEFFSTLLKTGSHRHSARQVATGNADVAALDAVCWHFLQKLEPTTAQALKVIGWSDQQPALPLITSLNTSDHTLDLMRQVLTSQPPEKPLAINRFDVLNIAEYNRLSAL